MKEATGELGNLLVVTTSVAILVAFFYFTIWPMIRNNFEAQTACEKAICEAKPDSKGLVNCKLNGNVFKCKYKG